MTLPTRTLSMLLPFIWALSVSAAELNVKITGIRSNDGDIHVALFNRAEQFPEHEGIFKEIEVPITNNQTSAVFLDLKPGIYAVAIYHDENRNDEFDQGFLGIPLENYGFSNGATAFLGPPRFNDAMFEISARGAATAIDLGN